MRFWSGHLRECLFLQPHVGVDIDLGCFDGFVPEPERDHGLVDAVMEQLHRGTVAQRVWRDAFAGEARAG